MIDEYVNKWIIKANNDLKVAENEINISKKSLVPEAICFHSQQAVEKYLKAYLVTRNVDFGKTHNLEFLLELCTKHDKSFENVEVGNLTSYAVDTRYPDDFYLPSIDEAKESLEIAKKVKKIVLNKLGIDK